MIFKFYKDKDGWEKDRWFIDLPNYQGMKQDLEMVEGADTLLDIMTVEDKVSMYCKEEYFEGANILTLDREDDILGGAHYTLEQYEDRNIFINVWLCEVTRFVFGYMPKTIYFKKV